MKEISNSEVLVEYSEKPLWLIMLVNIFLLYFPIYFSSFNNDNCT
jgi:hypothetical protein